MEREELIAKAREAKRRYELQELEGGVPFVEQDLGKANLDI